jgi:hypothetical protein
VKRRRTVGGSAEVVSIGTSASGPDLSDVACQLVADTRRELGLSLEQFAGRINEQTDWDASPGTVEAWEDDVIPPGDVVIACAWMTLQKSAGVPAARQAPDAQRASALLAKLAPPGGEIGAPESVRPFASREAVPREQWREIIDGSQDHLWLSGMAEFQYAIDDEVPLILAAAAEAGCDIRVLLLSPDYPDIGSVSTKEGNPSDTLPARIRAALHRFSLMAADIGPAMKIRTYSTAPAISIVRGDDRLLVTPYLPYTIGSNCPTFELTRGSAGRMFGRYETTFQMMWTTAEDWT